MKYIILISILLSCKIHHRTTDNPSYYESKTYFFMGNSFEEKYNSKIDTTNYSWKDRFQNTHLVEREYPKYQGAFKRKESFKYYDDKKLKEEVIETEYPNGTITKDTTLFIRKKEGTTEIVKLKKGKRIVKSVQRVLNDTLFIDHIIGGKTGFTSREFWETKTRKHDQIIRPELSKISNIYIHNQNGDLIGIERKEDGYPLEKTMTIQYKYDAQNRIVSKDTYYGEGKKRSLGSKEITIYE